MHNTAKEGGFDDRELLISCFQSTDQLYKRPIVPAEKIKRHFLRHPRAMGSDNDVSRGPEAAETIARIGTEIG